MENEAYRDDPVIMRRDADIARLELEIERVRAATGAGPGEPRFGAGMDAAIGLAKVPLLQAKIMAAKAAKTARLKILRLR